MKNKLALILSLLLLTACTSAARVDTVKSGSFNSNNRGICAVTTDSGMLITWKSFAADPESTTFELYRSGSLVYVSNPGGPTCYLDDQGSANDQYSLKTICGSAASVEDCSLVSADAFFDIPLDPPENSSCTYIPNYLILFFGVFFIMVMLAMAVGMPDTLDYYKANASDMMFADYQYVLKSFEDEDSNPITTDNGKAERFGMSALQIKQDVRSEEISVYGIKDDSRYVKIAGLSSLKEDEISISDSFRDKYGVAVGEQITLEEKYENKRYTFRVAGFYDKSLSLSAFLPMEQFRGGV